MRPEKYGDCRKLQFFDSLKKQDSEESCFFSYSLISVVYCLFALIHTVQERSGTVWKGWHDINRTTSTIDTCPSTFSFHTSFL